MLSITVTRDIETCHSIRNTVFVVEQGISVHDDIDGMDRAASHLLAVVDGKPVGTARLLEKGEIGKIGRLAVLIDHRGNGIGAALVKAALADFARRGHITEVRLGAQIEAIDFYKALGFVREGAPFLDAGFPHQEMVHVL